MAFPYDGPYGRGKRAQNVAYGNVPYNNVGFRALPKNPVGNPWIQDPGGGGGSKQVAKAPPQQTVAAETATSNLMDTGPDDSYHGAVSEDAMAARQHAQQGVQMAGAKGIGQSGRAPGYEVGTVAPGELLLKGVGMFSGVPGLGFAADKATAKMEEIGAPWFGVEGPRAGDFGSIDAATGGVYGGGGEAFDTRTGQSSGAYDSYGSWFDDMKGDWAGRSGAPGTKNYRSDAAVQMGVTPASVGGIMSDPGEAGIQNVLDMASTGQPSTYISDVGNVYDINRGSEHGTFAESEHTPGQGITLASGNLVTNDQGKILGSRIPGTAPEPAAPAAPAVPARSIAAPVQQDREPTGPGTSVSSILNNAPTSSSNEDYAREAFGGGGGSSNNDSGGGGGGGGK